MVIVYLPNGRTVIKPLRRFNKNTIKKGGDKTLKVIGILLIIVGILGILMGMMMFGDIGIACLVGAVTALLSGIGFMIVGKKLK